MDFINQITNEAKKILIGLKGSHDLEHTERVYNLCLRIGKKEGADMEVLRISAMLHDIGRDYQDKSSGNVCHAQKGSELASKLLLKYQIEKEKLNNIIHCIRTHRFREGSVPSTKEAKILFDADKLDSIGAVGIGRAFLFAGEIGAKLHNKDIDIEKTQAYSNEDTAYREYMVKLRKIKDKMLTTEGKRLAEERHNFMEKFFNRLNSEIDGKA